MQIQTRRWSGIYFSLLTSLLIVSCATNQNTAQTPDPPASATPEIASPALSPSAEPETPVAQADVPLEEAEIWAKLQNADEENETYAVLLRHAIAPSTGDPANFQLDDCSTQRNLSEEGRQQARAIGQAFRDRNIPVKQVFSSQWCRCLETAELMDIGTVEPFPPLNSFFRDRNTANAQTAAVLEILLNYRNTNQNRSGVIVMMTHQVNITALSGIVPRSGSAVVLQIDNNQFNVLGQLSESSAS